MNRLSNDPIGLSLRHPRKRSVAPGEVRREEVEDVLHGDHAGVVEVLLADRIGDAPNGHLHIADGPPYPLTRIRARHGQ